MPDVLRLLAPAKLNLYLRVLGKRPDGYHEIETVFERLDLADELVIEPHPDEIQLTCTDPTLSCGEDNLVLKAARLLHTTCRITTGARLHLIKRIPIAAGLGGGSSDAATTLMTLNLMWDLKLERATLVELAAKLGSDVPFFLAQTAFAVGRGRGERCEPLPQAPSLAHVLVTPPARLSTTTIYSEAQFNLTAETPSSSILLHALRNGSLGELAKGLYNDLEPEAIRRCPVISEIRSHLHDGGCLGVLTSGSGPTVFGICRDVTHARTVAQQIRQRGSSDWVVVVARTASPHVEGDPRRHGFASL